jgi:hypothetical protein
MAKKTKMPGKKKAASKAIVTTVPRGVRLDKPASDYAQLLSDPCKGPLVSGPFGDGGGGIVSRFEVDFIVNASATDTTAVVAFTPGLGSAYISSIALPFDSTAFTFTGVAADSPGLNYFSNNASAFRTLSACMQVYYPGSELSRAGITSIGQYSHATVTAASLTSSVLRSSATYVERVPDQMVELIWRPTNYDLEWFGVGTNEGTALSDKRSTLISTTTGIPISTGMRIRLVAVYEWMPLTTVGLVMPTRSSNPSANTFQDVIKKLDSFGDWMYHGALSVGSAASKLYAGARAVGQVAYGTTKMAAMLMG